MRFAVSAKGIRATVCLAGLLLVPGVACADEVLVDPGVGAEVVESIPAPVPAPVSETAEAVAVPEVGAVSVAANDAVPSDGVPTGSVADPYPDPGTATSETPIDTTSGEAGVSSATDGTVSSEIGEGVAGEGEAPVFDDDALAGESETGSDGEEGTAPVDSDVAMGAGGEGAAQEGATEGPSATGDVDGLDAAPTESEEDPLSLVADGGLPAPDGSDLGAAPEESTGSGAASADPGSSEDLAVGTVSESLAVAGDVLAGDLCDGTDGDKNAEGEGGAAEDQSAQGEDGGDAGQDAEDGGETSGELDVSASLLAEAVALDVGAPNTWNQVGGSWYWYDSQGLRADKGWVVTDVALPGSSSSGLQRYWLGDGGVLSFSSLITDVTAGWIAYATSSGYVVRGSYTDAATGYVYLANNDGVLENPGWLVTSAYSDDGQLQRYWIDDESHACEPGYSGDGWDHYTTDAGYVARGSYTDQDTGYVYLADNDGLLESPGWLVTSAYSDDGQLQRYWIDDESHACEPGYSGDGWAHYTTSRGYVLRGSWDTGRGRIYIADNDGRLINDGIGGWVVTGAFTNGELQRYFVDPTDHAVRSGEFEVTEDESSVLNGLFWGQANVGYVLRNTCTEIGTRWYQADNEGLLTYLATGKVGYQNPSQYYQLSAYDVVSSNPNAGIFSYVSPSLIRPDSLRSACVEAFISRAYDYLGTTYIWDYACAPGVGVDCAGLVLQCLYAVGMDLDYNYTPYDHYYTPGHDQYANAMRNDDKFMTVGVADRQRGDLICYEGHIAIYLGGDAVINAYPPNVHVQSMWDLGTVLAVKRVFV